MIKVQDEEYIKIAKDLIDNQDYSEAMEYLNQIPNNGEALYLMAEYIDRIGSRQKQHLVYADRFELLLYASYKGNGKAMQQLAELYKVGGRFFEKDEKKMFQWYLNAYNQGNKDVLDELINCYRNGIGTKQNFDLVMKLRNENNITK